MAFCRHPRNSERCESASINLHVQLPLRCPLISHDLRDLAYAFTHNERRVFPCRVRPSHFTRAFFAPRSLVPLAPLPPVPSKRPSSERDSSACRDVGLTAAAFGALRFNPLLVPIFCRCFDDLRCWGLGLGFDIGLDLGLWAAVRVVFGLAVRERGVRGAVRGAAVLFVVFCWWVSNVSANLLGLCESF